MSALAHRSADAPASTSRAGRHMRQTCLVRLRLHLTVVSQRCSSAPAASRGASSCALRCCSSSESTLTAAISALLRAQVEQDERQLLPIAWRRRRTAGHRLCAVTACSTPTRSCQACWMPFLLHLPQPSVVLGLLLERLGCQRVLKCVTYKAHVEHKGF